MKGKQKGQKSRGNQRERIKGNRTENEREEKKGAKIRTGIKEREKLKEKRLKERREEERK